MALNLAYEESSKVELCYKRALPSDVFSLPPTLEKNMLKNGENPISPPDISEQDIIEAINESGIYKFIQKPWKSSELKQIIAEAVDHYRLIKDKNLKKQIVQGSAAHDSSQVISGQPNAQSDATRFERPNKA